MRHDNRDLLATRSAGRKSRMPIKLILRPPIVDQDSDAFGIAGFPKSLAIGARAVTEALRRDRAEKADHWHRLLCIRKERPRNCGTAEHADQIRVAA